ncbi:hypothetical protein [Rhodopirellula halodulae]|uniref:hypothetical protein n=1 Tax=Rhodopirellula halodulae TaxID=2894198 RepID=UPI001E30CEC9|nr:hypothetical protein [Rhodopirellula sp. JC737]MCC9655499.1 hypothetical protein [Rhodopirellula sp. JC737]
MTLSFQSVDPGGYPYQIRFCIRSRLALMRQEAKQLASTPKMLSYRVMALYLD